MKRAGNNRCRFASFQFGLDARNPFHVTIFNKPVRNPGRLVAQSRVTGPKRIDIASAPCLVHPAEVLLAVRRLSKRVP